MLRMHLKSIIPLCRKKLITKGQYWFIRHCVVSIRSAAKRLKNPLSLINGL